MATAQNLPARDVSLPTAAAHPVHQPSQLSEQIRHGRETGELAWLYDQYDVREREARRALYEEAGIVKNGMLMLVTALLTALGPEQRTAARATLSMLNDYDDRAATRAAVDYADRIFGEVDRQSRKAPS